MCILLLTTHHPSYPLLILSNRDEFLHRPTARAHWWSASRPSSPDRSRSSSPSHPRSTPIFSGRDLARPERGTWLGITRSGRLAVLTNFSEKSKIMGTKSRGGLVRRFLEGGENIQDFVKGIKEGWGDVGGFSLLVGNMKEGRLCVVSNRGSEGWVEREKATVGLSNSRLEEPWRKVVEGRKAVEEVVQKAGEEGWDEERLKEALFGVLSRDTLPEGTETAGHDAQLEALKETIYVRPFETAMPTRKERRKSLEKNEVSAGGPEAGNLGVAHGDMDEDPPEVFPGMEKSTWYGTQKQTVILVRNDGHVRYIERTLYDDDAKPVPKEDQDVVAEFDIEGWRN